MNDGTRAAPGQQEPALQFERAEMAPATSCANCRKPLAEQFWTLNDKHVCGVCGPVLERHFLGPIPWSTWLRVLGRGSVAALLGTVIYFAVLKITGYELGLIAIIVGLLVGRAVKKASGARGGWKLQAIAMALTYASIVASYMPSVYQALRHVAAKKEMAATALKTAGTPDPVAPGGAPAAPVVTQETKPTFVSEHPVISAFLFVVILFAFAAVAPVLGGFQNFMGWIIIGIALYEAWKLNKRVPLVFKGPFPVTAAPASPAAEVPITG